MTFWDISGPGSFEWIISIVSSIAQPSLETVFITMSVDDEIGTLEHLPASFSALNSLFMNQPLSNNSTKLCFLIDRGVEDEVLVVRAKLKNGLPKLDGTKRLKFGI
jgi:hypothetical protein